HQRLPFAHGHLLALATPHLQLRLLVQPFNPFVVHQQPRLPELEMDHPHAIALVPLRQGQDPFPQLPLAIGPRLVAIYAGAHAHHRQRPALAQTSRHHQPHQRTACRCGHHFFRSASRVTSFSRSDSANSFFSCVFSVSSSRKRLASATPIPPNLLRHR